MTERVLAKLVIAAAGLVVFLTGVRTDLEAVRWIGIVLVTVAFLLRFVGPRGSGGRPAGPDSGA